MKILKFTLFLVPVLALVALFPALSRHPISLFVLREEGGQAEAFRLMAPLNGQDVMVEELKIPSTQQKEAKDILAQRDEKRLQDFAESFVASSMVIGIPDGEEGWPGYLGGGWKGIREGRGPVFDNLQFTDRLYLAFALKPPPAAPFVKPEAIPITVASAATVVPASTPNPVASPSVVRVEILNGCGITNAADWVARRIKGPGIIISDMGNADNFHYSKTLVRTSAGMPVALEEALGRLGLTKDSVEEATNLPPSVDAVLVVGKDYRLLRERYRGRRSH